MKNYTDDLKNHKFNISVHKLRKGDVIAVSVGKEFRFGPMIMFPKDIWYFTVKRVYGDSIFFIPDCNKEFVLMLQKNHEFFSWVERFTFIKRLNFLERLFL